jgi:hypothetical protein
MSPDILAALAIAIAPTIAIIVNSIIIWVTANGAARKLEHVAEITDKTHTIVNSQRTLMMEQIEVLKAEIVKLHAEIVAKGP